LVLSGNESLALGAIAALAVTLVKRKLTWKAFRTAVMETIVASTIIFLLFAGANIFTIFITYSGIVDAFATWLIGLGLTKTMLFTAILVMYIILGCFLDSISMMILTLPFVIPIIEAQGLSLIWFGVIMCMIVEIGCITPPMGLNVYVMKAAMGDSIELTEIFAGALPFVILMVLVVYILYAFPIIALWLPGLMK